MKAKRDDEREGRQVLPRPDIGRKNLKDVILFESTKRYLGHFATYRCNNHCNAQTGKRYRKDFAFIFNIAILAFGFEVVFFNLLDLRLLFEIRCFGVDQEP